MTAALFVILLLIGLPISIVLVLTALAYVTISGNTVLYASFSQQIFSGIESYGLLAIPLFMLAGELMNEGGLTRRLIALAGVFVGGFRGGLAYINLLANMMMASIVGSAASQIAIMSRAVVPEMERAGYQRPFAVATTAAGGLLAPIIPPSMLFVIYGVLAQIPIGDMFIAGILPGILMSIGFFLAIAFIGFKSPYPAGSWPSADERIKAIWFGLPAGLIPLVIVGGILFGIATPTESAAVAAVAAFILGKAVYRELDLKKISRILYRAGINASIVIFLIAAANVFGWVIVYEQLPQKLAAWLASLTADPFVFMLLINLLLLGVGMVIDGIAALILVVPILLPIAQETFGINPFHFGVVICINLVLGLLTPPVGAGLFVAATISDVKPGAIFRAIWPFLLSTVIVLVLLSWQPILVTAFID